MKGLILAIIVGILALEIFAAGHYDGMMRCQAGGSWQGPSSGGK